MPRQALAFDGVAGQPCPGRRGAAGLPPQGMSGRGEAMVRQGKTWPGSRGAAGPGLAGRREAGEVRFVMSRRGEAGEVR